MVQQFRIIQHFKVIEREAK